jgi:hypothetical protein
MTGVSTTYLPDHLELYLGEMSGGVAVHPRAANIHLQVARFDKALPGAAVFATLGLSHLRLHSAGSGKVIRQELVMGIGSVSAQALVPGIIEQVADRALATGHALLRGEVIGPWGPIFPGSKVSALYVAPPPYLPDGFAICKAPFGEIVFAWLLPVYENEAEWIRKNGWRAFESLIVEGRPALLDPDRPPLLE